MPILDTSEKAVLNKKMQFWRETRLVAEKFLEFLSSFSEKYRSPFQHQAK